MGETQSLCGAAKLLSKVFDMELNQVKTAIGISVPGIPTCPECGKPVRNARYFPYCPRCGRSKLKWVSVECTQCGKIVQKQVSSLVHWIGKRNKQHLFCNRHCLGQWNGKHYGFGVHPENGAKFGGRKRKWDWDVVWQTHLKTGYGALRLSRLLKIPESTIDVILRKQPQN